MSRAVFSQDAKGVVSFFASLWRLYRELVNRCAFIFQQDFPECLLVWYQFLQDPATGAGGGLTSPVGSVVCFEVDLALVLLARRLNKASASTLPT